MSKIITVLVLIIIYESIELYKSYKANIILENVKWALSSENLRMFTFGSQDEVSMEDKYWFSDDEVDMVLEILICFKKEMVNYYFKGLLKYNKFRNFNYFILYLNNFLWAHVYDDEFLNHTMYNKRGKHKHEHFYELTDFAVAYCKLLYLSQLYVIKLYKIDYENAYDIARAKELEQMLDKKGIDG